MRIAEQFAGLQMDQLSGGGCQRTSGELHGGFYQQYRI
jgi:hypothetical protein